MVIYVCQDFSIDLFKYDKESNKKIIDHLWSMSLYLLINKPTHNEHRCHAIIDDIFTNI